MYYYACYTFATTSFFVIIWRIIFGNLHQNYVYDDDEEPVIKELVRESRPGLRKYLSYKDVKPYKGGLGLKVLTTSKGLMTDKDAIKKQLGGEVICRVF